MSIHGNKKTDQMRFSDAVKQYEPLIDSAVSKYINGYDDPDDLRQEAMIALYGAYMTYDRSQKDVTFGLYAKICIKNRLVSVLRKNRPCEDLSMYEPLLSESPEDTLIAQEECDRILGIANELLTPYERSVLELYLKNVSYKDIASELSVSVKSVDNAIYRIKAKLRRSI